ncbi:MAG: phosphoribosylglycinamide formyltransferase [Candidatus Omnitrophica bacterium]|nr:phosphoribosylglycinamide formyltransferase [Candidatus Omnitrophota bacterium]
MKTIAILASGNGTNAENIARAIQKKKVKASLALIFSNKRDAKVLDRAKKLNVPYVSFEVKDFESREAYESQLIKLLQAEKVDVIVLAGYMLLVGDAFIQAFKNRILNIHPSLLPAFKGTHAIQEAYDYGVRVSGVTVHFVEPALDSGPIILQKEVPLRDGESVQDFESRIHKVEYELYPKALQLVVSDKCSVRGRKVIIKK